MNLQKLDVLKDFDETSFKMDLMAKIWTDIFQLRISRLSARINVTTYLGEIN